MLENRNLKNDLAALALVALTIFLAAALLSYDPADPPATLVFPAHSEIANACGRSGAMASHVLLTTIGVGAYFLLASLIALDAALLLRQRVSDPLLRLFGWLLALTGFSALAAMLVPSWSPGPVIGSGGYLGASVRGMLEMHFAAVGSYIFAASLLVSGLLLATDYFLVRIAHFVLRVPIKGLGHGVLHVGSAYAEKLAGRSPRIRGRRNDVDGVAPEDMAVRFPGRPAEEHAAEPAAEIPPEEQPTGSDDETPQPAEPVNEEIPQPAAKGKRASLASFLFRRGKREVEHQQTIEELEAATVVNDENDTEYELPSADLLLPTEPFSGDEQEKEVRRKAKILEKTFADFGFNIRVVEIQTGPVIAQFEVELEAGLRLSRITGLADDLAIALRVPSVRIVAPIPGKNTVGIEVPNNERQLVRLREVMDESSGKWQKMRIPLFLGKDVSGHPMIVDLTTLPHLLIAGRTGTGKSVCLNTIIVSMLMTRRPDEVRMLMIDPKMVELSPYKSLPHLMHPVVTDMRKAEAILGWAVEKMEERYSLLARAGVRHVSVYNQLGEEELMERIRPENDEERKMIPLQMPYIVVVADEMADLMMTSAKEVEGHIIRLAQKSRAVGIHLVLATQKPTVDVITGLIKSNLPARISFQVASRTDSRVVLDEMGADKLLGNGDLLFLWPGTSTLLRGQGTYLSDDEINKVIAAVATTEPQFVKELVQLKASDPAEAVPAQSCRDELYEAAVEIVIREGRGSVSLLQRALGIGYGRAARLIDYMAEDGIVGTYNGSQAREVLITLADWEARNGRAPAAASGNPPAASPRRTGKIVLEEDRQAATEAAGLSESAAEVNSDDAYDVAEGEEVPFEELSDEEPETSEGDSYDDDFGDEDEEDDEDEYDDDPFEESEEDELDEDAGPKDTPEKPWKAESA